MNVGPLHRGRRGRPIGWLVVVVVGSTCGLQCGAQEGAAVNDLSAMQTDHIQIQGTTFDVWLALTPAEQELGLMQVEQATLDPIPPDPANGLPDGAQRGMLFVFPDDELRAFWMFNTIIPLDIAFIRSDGMIVSTHTMAPLETRLYPSIEPAQYALEVRAGLFAELGIAVGDHVEIPSTVLKGEH